MEGKHFQEHHEPAKAKSHTIEGEVEAPKAEAAPVEPRDVEKDLMDIAWAESLDHLQEIYTIAYKHFMNLKDKKNMTRLVEAKDKRKAEIEAEPKEEINPETGEIK